jgi:HlyD family secretion protein
MQMKKWMLISPAIAVFLIAGCNKTKTVKPVRKSITEAVYASGYIVPKDEYKVYALADGYITERNVDAGNAVVLDQPLFKIQSDVSSARYAASQTAFDYAAQNIGDNSPILRDLLVRVNTAQAKCTNDSMNFVRYKNLLENNAIARVDYDRIALTYQTSQNELLSAKENYRRTRDQLRVDAKNAQSQLTSSGSDLGYFTVKSHMKGLVYDVYKEIGEAVRKNDVLAMIGDGDHKILQLNVDQQDIEKVKIGQAIIVKIDATADNIYKAKVSKIYPLMNQNDQSFKVEAEFDSTYQFQFSHSSVEANIIINKKDNALLIPIDIIQDNNQVQVKGGAKTTIKKGLQNLEYVEVLEGIKASDELEYPKIK